MTSIRNLIKTDLRRSMLEDSISANPATSADNILTSLNLVLNNDHITVMDSAEELDVEELAEVNAMVEFEGDGHDEQMATSFVENDSAAVGTVGVGDKEDDWLPDSVEKLTKKKMHEYMLKDPWAIGREKLDKMDVVFTREERARRLKKKSRIRECILNGIKDLVENQLAIVVPPELEVTNHCQQYTRGRRNNLNLV